MRYKKILNLLTLLVVFWIVFQQGSLYLKNQSAQGHDAPPFELPLLTSEQFNLQSLDRPLVVVFWATWCGPCQVELARVNHMIENHEIKAESVLAITSFEEGSVVSHVAKDRSYQFPIGLDQTGSISQSYNVSATPTVIFVYKDKKIEWMSTGLSPLLGIRIRNFLK